MLPSWTHFYRKPCLAILYFKGKRPHNEQQKLFINLTLHKTCIKFPGQLFLFMPHPKIAFSKKNGAITYEK